MSPAALQLERVFFTNRIVWNLRHNIQSLIQGEASIHDNRVVQAATSAFERGIRLSRILCLSSFVCSSLFEK